MTIKTILHFVFRLALEHTQLLLDHINQLFHACASHTAYSRRSVLKLRIRSEIHFVPYLQHALIVKRRLKLQLFEDLENGVLLQIVLRMRDIPEVKHQIRVVDFLESTLEGFHHFHRQIGDEAYCIEKDYFCA